jgi:hypothetical protein
MLRPVVLQRARVLDINRSPFTCPHTKFTTCAIYSELRKIRLAQDLPARNHCVSLGLPVIKMKSPAHYISMLHKRQILTSIFQLA